MNDTDVTARLAEALTDDVLVPVERGPVVTALLPVVREIADLRGAEARRRQQLWDRSRVEDYAAVVGVELTPSDDMMAAVDELYRAAALRGEAGR